MAAAKFVNSKKKVIQDETLLLMQCKWNPISSLTLSWRGSLSYRNQFTDLLCKSMDWFPHKC